MTDDPVQGASEIILYSTKNDQAHIQRHSTGEIIWFTQGQMAEQFRITSQNITLHLLSADSELDERAACKEYLQVRKEGRCQVTRSFTTTISTSSIGYLARSHRGRSSDSGQRCVS